MTVEDVLWVMIAAARTSVAGLTIAAVGWIEAWAFEAIADVRFAEAPRHTVRTGATGG